MFLCCGPRIERPEIASFACLGIFFARVKSILARFEFPDHSCPPSVRDFGQVNFRLSDFDCRVLKNVRRTSNCRDSCRSELGVLKRSTEEGAPASSRSRVIWHIRTHIPHIKLVTAELERARCCLLNLRSICRICVQRSLSLKTMNSRAQAGED